MTITTHQHRPVDLYQRAEAFERTVEQSLVDGGGLLLSLIDMKTMKPFPIGFFNNSTAVHCYPGADYQDFSGVLNYENVGMVTGAYLCAQVWKYRATGWAGPLKVAGRCFAGLRHLYERCQAVERGYFCKNYDNRLSDQTSSDQYLYVMAALDAYAEVAAPRDRTACSRMIGQMAQWWIRRDYQYPYFGKPLAWPVERFAVFAFLAYRHTGDAAFLAEYKRLCRLESVRQAIPFGIAWKKLMAHARDRAATCDFEQHTQQRLFSYKVEAAGSGFLSLSAMLQHHAPLFGMWRQKVWELYEMGRRGMAGNGLAMTYGILDLRTGQVKELRKVIHDGSDHPTWQLLGFRGWIRSGMTAAMMARAAVGMQPYLKTQDTLSLAAHILRKLDHDQLRWRIDVDGCQWPLSLKWVDRVFSGDAITNWLWAYWEGRARYGQRWAE